MTEKRVAVGSKPAQQLKELIARGKEQGYLTYVEVNDHLPNDIVDPEQIEDIVNMINDMGITVHEKAPDAETLLMSETTVSNDDDDAAEEAEAALASVAFWIAATLNFEFARLNELLPIFLDHCSSPLFYFELCAILHLALIGLHS